jgi:hypothetical protein
MGFGLKLEVTPAGTGPVRERVTEPVKLKSEVPVIVMLPELPCAIVTVGAEGERLKSGVETTSFAILFAPDSATQTLPELSTATSWGVLADMLHSVNWPFGTPVFELDVGVTGTGELAAALGGEAERAPRTGANAVTVGEAPPETVPPPVGSSCATLLAPSSATHGF